MIGQVPKGSSRSFPFQVMLPDLVTPFTAFLGSDALTATVWPGDDLPATMTPSASWVDATTSKWSLDFVPLDTMPAIVPPATSAVVIEPGVYRVRVTATRGSAVAELLRDTVEILVTEGAGTAAPVYCTFEDMAAELSWIGQFLNDAEDQTGYREQRARARLWMDGLILRAAPVSGPGSLISRQSWWSWSYSGVDPRNGTGLAIDQVLKGYLDAGGLVLTGPAGSPVVTATACYSIALVLRAQQGLSPEQSKLAGYFARRANAVASQIVAEIVIDTVTPGARPAYAIALGTTNTRYA